MLWMLAGQRLNLRNMPPEYVREDHHVSNNMPRLDLIVDSMHLHTGQERDAGFGMTYMSLRRVFLLVSCASPSSMQVFRRLLLSQEYFRALTPYPDTFIYSLLTALIPEDPNHRERLTVRRRHKRVKDCFTSLVLTRE